MGESQHHMTSTYKSMLCDNDSISSIPIEHLEQSCRASVLPGISFPTLNRSRGMHARLWLSCNADINFILPVSHEAGASGSLCYSQKLVP